MLERTYCINLLLENATSFTEKAKIHALTEAEQAVVNDRMVGSLYQSILNKKDIDFEYGRLGSYVYFELLQAINKQVEELGWLGSDDNVSDRN